MKHLGLVITALVLLAIGTASYGALNLEGQSGVFLNTLAYPMAAGQMEASAHTVGLDDLGEVNTFNFTSGLVGNMELGFTQVGSSVAGVSNQNVLHAKWQFLPESKSTPAVAVYAQNRNINDVSTTLDYGVSATKVVTVLGHATVLDLGVRSTEARGLGLFGLADDREWKMEGALGVFINKKLCIATEFKQMIDARTWTDIAVRYQVSDKFNLDAGIANLSSGLDNQFALAATWKL